MFYLLVKEKGAVSNKGSSVLWYKSSLYAVGDTNEWLPSNSISKKEDYSLLATCVENALKNNPELWKIPERFEKEKVLENLTNLYYKN